jgi:hypothetical protein
VYMYIMRCVSVKSCKFILCRVKQCKNCDFYLGMGGFHNVFSNRPTKWPIAKNEIIKTFVFCDASLLIKLINMNHNKYN